MHRVSSAFALFLGLMLLVAQALPAFAQVDAQEGSATGVAGGSAALGEPVAVTNDAGQTVGAVTIAEVIDPFTAVNPDYPAEAGSRFVAVRAIFDANAGARFDIAPYTIVLQDQTGAIWDSTSLILPDDALVPQLSSQTLGPDSRVSGLIGFQLPEGATPVKVFYQPVSSRLVLLAELVASTLPPVGTAVPYTDSNGGVGIVTVREIVDPFDGVDPSYAAEPGSRYVYAELTFENNGEGPFWAESYGLLLQDRNGDLWSPQYVTRVGDPLLIPDLGYTQLAPGDRLTGAVVFSVPQDATLTGLFSSPTGEQLLPLAAIDGAADASAETGATTTPETSATVEAAPDATPEVIALPVYETPEPEADASACAALQTWLLAGTDQIAGAQGLANQAVNASDSTALNQISAQFALLADDETAVSAPAGGEAAQKALVATLRALSGATADAATAIDAGDDPANALALVSRASDRLVAIQVEMARVTGACVES
ncbi:MAG: DUF4352 domain-containing protein [Thermomicrobiales bacterium]